MAKGSEFEREFCKDLSLWWTDQERDDIFWRSSNSGGRATVRAKVGRTTAGQYGDVAAIDFDGLPLLELMTMELKRGYSKNTIQDLVDNKETYEFLKTKTCFQNQPVPFLRLQTKIKQDDKTDLIDCDCVLMRWKNWKRGIKPSILRKLT